MHQPHFHITAMTHLPYSLTPLCFHAGGPSSQQCFIGHMLVHSSVTNIISQSLSSICCVQIPSILPLVLHFGSQLNLGPPSHVTMAQFDFDVNSVTNFDFLEQAFTGDWTLRYSTVANHGTGMDSTSNATTQPSQTMTLACPVDKADDVYGRPHSCTGVSAKKMSTVRTHLTGGRQPHLPFLGFCNRCSEHSLEQQEFEKQHGYRSENCSRRPYRPRGGTASEIQWKSLFHLMYPDIVGIPDPCEL